MLRYSSPAPTTASGVRNGCGSIGSRMSITTLQPARFRAVRCSGPGWPPVTIPGIGSQAFATPAMASSSWLIAIDDGSRAPHNQAHSHASAFCAPPLPRFLPPPGVALSPLEAAPEAVAQLGRGVPDGPALSRLPRRRGPHRDDSRGGPGRGVELPHLPEPHPPDGAGARGQGPGHRARRLARWRCAAHGRGAPPGEGVRPMAARGGPAESRRLPKDPGPIGTTLPIARPGATFSPVRGWRCRSLPCIREVPLCALVAAAQTPAPAPAPAPVSTTPRLHGYLQPRFQTLGDSASFFLRRARITVEGDVTPWAAYRVQIELRTLGAAAVPAASPLTLSATDLLIRMRQGRWGGTVGQFRVPFSLESLLGSTTLETNERSRIVNAAKRDIGVQAEWGVPGRLLLQAAMVNGKGPNRAANPDNRMAYFARAVVTPVKGLDVGGALEGYSDSTGANLQGVYRAARWTARAEYIREHNRATDVHTTGWYALGGYYAVPKLLELVGRVQRFEPSDKVATGQMTGYLIGAQYFMRGDDFKIVADYEWFRDQVVQVAGNRGVVQLQVRW